MDLNTWAFHVLVVVQYKRLSGHQEVQKANRYSNEGSSNIMNKKTFLILEWKLFQIQILLQRLSTLDKYVKKHVKPLILTCRATLITHPDG